MEQGQVSVELSTEVKEFVKFLKSLNEKQQIGLIMTLEGLQLLANKKSGKNR